MATRDTLKPLPVASMPNRVRELRMKAGMNLRQVAELCGVSPQCIHRLEQQNLGSWRLRLAVADVFDVHPRDLQNPHDLQKKFASK